MKQWRHHLAKDTNEAINHLVRRALPQKDAFLKNKHVRTNQLWVALADMHKEIDRVHTRLTETEQELTHLKGILHRTGTELTRH